MGKDVKTSIVARRRQRMTAEGPAFGHPIPAQRQAPLIAFDREPFVICEVKRKSPSRGAIAAELDAVAQARRYVQAGVQTISVLTEEDWFGGSLADLMAIKQAFPDVAVLRKDFLFCREDLDVAWRAGADAVLLIASILAPEQLADLKSHAEALGMAVLVEIHDAADCEKAAPLQPAFTGINCRDLSDFSIDRAIPLMTKALVSWPTRLIFESGILRLEQAQWVAQAGFQGILVGEGAVKDPLLAAQLAQGFEAISPRHPSASASFWAKLFARPRLPGRPLVKICGLARQADVRLADELGADLLGFVLASSPRQVDYRFIREAPATQALKVGVVQLGPGERLPEELRLLLESGALDAIQFHGQEDPDLVDAWSDRAYKALSLARFPSGAPWSNCIPPRILADAAMPGSGIQIADLDLRQWVEQTRIGRRLWLAGGLNPDNIAHTIAKWRPELIDAASGLEQSPGRKDAAKLRLFFKEISHACA